MDKIHIRKAELVDAENLSELICENAQQILKPHYNEEQWNSFIKFYSVDVVRKKIEDQIVFCAEKEGKIVGTIALEGDFVVGFYTQLQNMNQGIGKLLITHVESYAANIGFKKLQLEASPEGLAFYYKNGWRKVNEVVIELYGVAFEETLMIKDLSK